MSKVVYLGNKAGLQAAGKAPRGASGNTSSPFDYVLVCTCGLELGPLGRFRQNGEGYRSAYCDPDATIRTLEKEVHGCGRLVVVDRNAQIATEKLLTPEELRDLILKKGQEQGASAS